MMLSSGTTSYLNYWVAARPIPGQDVSGDQFVVAPFDGGTLVAVIDGLGHGAGAAQAAMHAAETLRRHAQEPVVSLMERCHKELRKMRGAVISMASFDAATATMSWLGVGNVEGVLLGFASDGGRARTSLVTRGGIVGDRLPQLLPASVLVKPGDLLLFATDGICSMFIRDLGQTEHPCQLVHHIFVQHAKTTDDALILGAQWMNGDAGATNREQMNPGRHPRTNP